MSQSEVILEQLHEDGLSAIQPLFARVFGHELSLPMLHWKYAGSRGQSWVARLAEEPDPLVHCGVCFRDVLFQGRPVRAGQLVDLMAAPKGFGLSRKASPFALLLKHILDQSPEVLGQDGIVFGFPSGRSMRLAEHCGVATEVERWLELQLLPERTLGAPRLREWQGSGVDILAARTSWSRMSASLEDAALGVRDLAFLNRRYLQHPAHGYRLFVAESAWLRRPIGLVVARIHGRVFELLDLLAAWEDMPQLLGAVRNSLTAQGGDSAILSLTSRFARQLAPFVSEVRETEFRIMGNPYSPEATLQALRGRWWLTGGDTDYR
ncbi:hypothetical protein [Azovibrio restrictus]|uniref:hypothetical protein n=1 Tax=Azovibrio restrictus TaxID=146938 RepID=UPI0026EA4ABA|nr:hypothetical protein [Azovibrio restrictus]MDD3483265.1 hypothetical protein [Azovibrio restrictus]